MSQNSLVLATSGTLSGLAAVQGINAALDTLNTLASGASAPASPEAGQLWHDTANRQVKIRAMDNTSWIVIGTLDETGYAFSAANASALAGTLPIANGGTGAASQAAGLTALLGASTVPKANGGTGTTDPKNLWTFSTGTNGYEVAPSGRITQWGITGSFVSGGVGVVTFPIAFPNACLNLGATLIGGAGITNGATVYGAIASGFYLVNQSNIATTIYWHAEGY